MTRKAEPVGIAIDRIAGSRFGSGRVAVEDGRPKRPLIVQRILHPDAGRRLGAGPHHCIGNILGRTTISIAMARLLARFPKARISDPNFTPTYGGAVGELRLQSLPMVIQ